LRAIDERFRQAFIKRQHPVETIQFLQRFRTAIKKHQAISDPVRAGEVLYPRGWSSPAGERSRSAIKGRRMPWKDLPITGVSLYEAAAYTVWLSEMTELDVSLPTEFEYERAASWGTDAGCIKEGADAPVVLDPGGKDILPWKGKKDFNFYFGREGAINVNKRTEYERLLEATGRHVNGKRIDQLLGFGWQWSLDRYNETERKYNRFESANYPVYSEREAVAAGDEEKSLTVYEYEPYRSLDSPHFVLRGSPDVIGGAGLTTRRFAAFPLRGNRNISFRITIRPEDSAGCGGGL
ncbi:MAG: SUMF1/EgtB/PvdO family nonheme iron enzyme, partial [Planctomycetota bacterium]